MLSDEELIKTVLAGRRKVFAELVRRYERTVHATAAAVLGNYHTAQDAAQQAFLVAYQKLPTLRRQSAFGGWVMKIARREALRIARYEQRATSPELFEAPDADNPNGRIGEASQRLLTAIMKLPRHERIVVLLRYFDRQNVKEIAEITHRSVGTVTKQLSRAHEHLRRRLGGPEL
ncbi:hypothetical protein LCGC14_2333770 [marine sediment metagenome]|uniref:Sigma-70 family RNA polymerase sigma factor n=1 Tax=marine sediment metagenome TaxID=412755 RepID=A0A0F9D1J0_9ZZZZ